MGWEQLQFRSLRRAAQPCCSWNPVPGWQKQAEPQCFLQNHPRFDLWDCLYHIYMLFTHPPYTPLPFFQSQSTSPNHQSFFSLRQLLCSQIRPQATKIWVSNTFSQQLCNSHVSSKSLQPRLAVSSELSPPPSHPTVSSTRTASSGDSGLRNKQGFWVCLGNLTCRCLAGHTDVHLTCVF